MPEWTQDGEVIANPFVGLVDQSEPAKAISPTWSSLMTESYILYVSLIYSQALRHQGAIKAFQLKNTPLGWTRHKRCVWSVNSRSEWSRERSRHPRVPPNPRDPCGCFHVSLSVKGHQGAVIWEHSLLSRHMVLVMDVRNSPWNTQLRAFVTDETTNQMKLIILLLFPVKRREEKETYLSERRQDFRRAFRFNMLLCFFPLPNSLTAPHAFHHFWRATRTQRTHCYTHQSGKREKMIPARGKHVGVAVNPRLGHIHVLALSAIIKVSETELRHKNSALNVKNMCR